MNRYIYPTYSRPPQFLELVQGDRVKLNNLGESVVWRQLDKGTIVSNQTFVPYPLGHNHYIVQVLWDNEKTKSSIAVEYLEKINE